MAKSINLRLEEFESFYCPICGKQLIGSDADETYCKHTLFIFSDIADFVYVNDEMKQYADIWHDDDEWDKMEEQDIGIMDLMEKNMPKNTSILFEIETRGMACGGPASASDYIGIDFCP